MSSFFQPLRNAGRDQVLLWSTVLLLSALKILWGDHEFFMERFAPYFEDPERAEWWGWTYDFLCTFLLFACLPLLFWKRVYGDLKGIGFTMGDYRFGLKATAIAFIVLPLPAWIASKDPAHLELYPLSPLAVSSLSAFLLWTLLHTLHYIGWEFFYRGFVGMGMRGILGAFGALMLQVLLTTLMHIDKPNGETLGTIVGGVYLGLLTYRSGSVWYAVIFHAYLGTLNTLFCS